MEINEKSFRRFLIEEYYKRPGRDGSEYNMVWVDTMVRIVGETAYKNLAGPVRAVVDRYLIWINKGRKFIY